MIRITTSVLLAALSASLSVAGEPEAIKALVAVGAKVPLGKDKKPQGQVELYTEDVKDEHLKWLAEFKSLPLVAIGQNTKVTADGMRQLADVKGLLRVSVSGKTFGDPHAKSLAALTNLEAVYFRSGELTDDGVKELAKLTKLTFLDFKGNKKVTGKTLGEFKGAKGLTGFDLSGTTVTGETLGALKLLPELKTLSANSTPFSDAGMKELAKLPKLKRVELHRTAVTDAGLAELKGLASLEELEIAGSKVGDGAIPLLAGLKTLKQLAVGKDQFTKLDELKKALPKCNVRVITPLVE